MTVVDSSEFRFTAIAMIMFLLQASIICNRHTSGNIKQHLLTKHQGDTCMFLMYLQEL